MEWQFCTKYIVEAETFIYEFKGSLFVIKIIKRI
jgi:hypothetical protein